jgi:predicted permease
LFRDATERLAALPGVQRAAAGYCLPIVGGCDHVRMKIDGEVNAPQSDHEVDLNMVDDAYLTTLGIPVVAGRGFARSDSAESLPVALVSEAAARRYWPGRNPIGERIRLSVGWPEDEGWAEIVGMVGDTNFGADLRAAARPTVYLALPQFSYRANYLVAAVAGSPDAAISAMRVMLRDLDPQLPLWDPVPISRHVAAATGAERFSLALLGIFGLLATTLAAVGIYGVIAYSVAGRTREIGLRMALGARPQSVLGLVFRQGFTIVGAGLIVGALVALASTRVLRAQLYEVRHDDPATLLAVLAILAGVAAAAIWLPARRAARVTPLEALRQP